MLLHFNRKRSFHRAQPTKPNLSPRSSFSSRPRLSRQKPSIIAASRCSCSSFILRHLTAVQRWRLNLAFNGSTPPPAPRFWQNCEHIGWNSPLNPVCWSPLSWQSCRPSHRHSRCSRMVVCTTCKLIVPRPGTPVNGVCKHVVNVRWMATPCTVARTSRCNNVDACWRAHC